MEGMTSIQELEACTIELSKETDIHDPKPGFSFPNLRRLAMTRLDADRDSRSLDMMAILLDSSPNVETLRIDGTWRPRLTGVGQLKAIGRAKALNTIAVSREEEDDGELGGIAFRQFDQVPLGMEQAAVEVAIDEANELDLDVGGKGNDERR